MAIYLVRHAKAGNRSGWIGDDCERPLSDNGWTQARLLARRFHDIKPSVLLSSPYLRCVQTLEPLAELYGLEITIEQRLIEESPLKKSLAVVEEALDNAVLCSHGDVIPDVMAGLIRRGMDMDSFLISPKKGSVFVLHREGTQFVRAEYWSPPLV